MTRPPDNTNSVTHSAREQTKASRRIWWGLGSFTVLLIASVGALVFEAVTGRLSGTVVQAKVGRCSAGGLGVTAFRRDGSGVTFVAECVPAASAPIQTPRPAVPLIFDLRARIWESTFGASHAFALDKPSSMIFHVKTGDIIQMRADEHVTLLSWETNYSTERWAVTARIAP